MLMLSRFLFLFLVLSVPAQTTLSTVCLCLCLYLSPHFYLRLQRSLNLYPRSHLVALPRFVPYHITR